MQANLLPAIDAGLHNPTHSLLPSPQQSRLNRPEPSRGPIAFVSFLWKSGIVKKC
ncbi:hypothetical protein [Microcoleus sp. AT9b-C4]|uniref:hypothetical protein n=1 Tax=Microcoleus sp. AT9b-C4 TaxID=2818630 RepID=UPI002FCF1327